MTPADGNDEGLGFLRDMTSQSARAHEFDRRLQWSRLSRQLRADDDVAGHAAETEPEPEPEPEPEKVVDLRDDPEPAAPDGATTNAAPEVPRPRRRESGPGRPTGR